MKAVTVHGHEEIRVEEVPDPRPSAARDAIVRVELSGICGSDLHIYNGEIPGVTPGSVIGHEYVGVVEDTGDGVRRFETGDRVVGPFHIACGECRACRRGDHHQCDRGGVLGYGLAFGDLPGAQAERVRIPFADVNLRRLPEDLDAADALLCGDILTTAFGAVRNAGISAGETVAVIGCGPVGLCAVQCCRLLGAARTLALDLVEDRANRAAALGAIPIASQRVNPVARVAELTDGDGADAVIEAVGGPATLELAFDLVRGGGRISAVGVSAAETFDYPLLNSMTKDVTFRVGLANIHRDIDATLALVAAGRVDTDAVISDRVPLDDAPEAYRRFAERRSMKILFELD